MAEEENKVKSLETKPQKELMRDYKLLNVAYIALTFVAPVITSILMFSLNNRIAQKWKFPICLIILLVAVIFAATRFFKKAISKISILNIDGSYNVKNQRTKHGLELLSSSIIPVTLLVVSILMVTKFQEYLNFYTDLIITCLSFFIVGILVDKFGIAFYDDEIAIREQVKNSNAVSRRKDSLKD